VSVRERQKVQALPRGLRRFNSIIDIRGELTMIDVEIKQDMKEVAKRLSELRGSL
jgi:hypothetical protein